jgi:NADH dehydrogenase/NADH:ubiquinone oxidoreductase subunit G
MRVKHIVELLLSEHRADCTKCYKNQKCELQTLANEYAFGDHIFSIWFEHKNLYCRQVITLFHQGRQQVYPLPEMRKDLF